MSDRQAAQSDQQVVGDDFPNDGLSLPVVQVERTPLTMNPDPMGLATGNSAIKEDMNMKTKPSFNILIYGFFIACASNRIRPTSHFGCQVRSFGLFPV